MALSKTMTEIWCLYAISTVILILRYVVRFRTVGIKGLFWDDLTCFGIVIFNTLDSVTVYIVGMTGENSTVTKESLATMSQHSIERLTLGSQMEWTAWWSYTALIWCMKLTMLFFYKRLTLGSFHNRLINYLFWFTGLCYVGVVMALIFGCFPTYMNWQVSPVPPWKCSFRPQNFLSVAILNIVTDAAILCVPLPMLWRLKIPLRKKIVIGIVLSSGLFVIGAALIRAVLSLDRAPSAANINGWGVRETFIGIFAINVPIIRPLFSKAFWKRGPYNPNGKIPSLSSYAPSGTRNSNKNWKSNKLQDVKAADNTEYEMDSEFSLPDSSSYPSISHSHSSLEEILPSKDEFLTREDRVMVETSFNIRSHVRDEEMGSSGDLSTTTAWNNIGVPR